jgi:pimeloyl-ACP methyl ester carboxylesterase
MTTTSVGSHRAPINGLDMYYEIRGSGEPLVMLHGAILVDVGPSVQALAQERMVIVPHLQGRGHTRDIDKPYTYEAMADDVAALLGVLGIPRATILGQSMGAGVALRVGLRHSHLVDRLILVSTVMASQGWHPKVQQELVEMGSNAAKSAAEVAKSDLPGAYPEVNWETLFRKTSEFQQQPYDLTETVRSLAIKTLLVFADEDAITPDHIVQFWKALGGGKGEAGLNGEQRSSSRLAIMTNANHSTAANSPAFLDTVRDFLPR